MDAGGDIIDEGADVFPFNKRMPLLGATGVETDTAWSGRKGVAASELLDTKRSGTLLSSLSPSDICPLSSREELPNKFKLTGRTKLCSGYTVVWTKIRLSPSKHQ